MKKTQSLPRSRMTVSQWMELLLDSLCCIAMTIGAMLAFDQLFRFHVDMGTMAYHAAVIVAVLALGTRRKWILPAAIGTVVVFGLLFVLITGQWAEFIAYIQGFIDWWIATFPEKSSYYTDFNVALVQWIVHILITSFLFLCVRGIKQVWAMIICAAFLFWIIIINGFRGNNLMSLLWLCAGMFPLFSRYASASMPWLKGQSKETQRESRKKWRKPAWYVYATAAVFTAICVALSLFLLPIDTEELQSRPLANVAEDVQSVIGVENKMYTGFEEMGLTTLGLQPQEDKLGGDIILDDSTNVLKIKTETPTLLKGRVYTTYDGKSWSSEDSTYYRLGSSLFTDEYYQAFDLDKPESEDGQLLISSIGANVGMTVTVLQPNSSALFTAGRVLSFEEKTPARSPVLYNMNAEVFINDYPVDSAYQYTFTGQVFSRGDATFTKNVDALLAEAGKNPDLLYNSTEFQQTYLTVPDDMPSIVKQRAEEITYGQIRPYDMMVALENALRTQYAYTLTPGETPDGEDFVGYFLETGSGYCVHFASAMTMMARTVGVPSRLVVGYGLEQDEKGDQWYARRKNAHAWTECYFEGLGWVAFDPTSGSEYANLNQEEMPQPSEQTVISTVTRFDDTAPTGTRTSAVIDQDGKGTPSWIIHTAITSMVVLVLVALAILLLKRLRHSEIAYTPEVVQKRFPDPGQQADYYYTDMVRQLKLLHYVPKNRETMKHFAVRVEQGVGLEPDAMRQVFDIMMRWRYGKIAPTEDEVALVETAHEHLEKRLYDEMNAVYYFIRRRLML